MLYVYILACHLKINADSDPDPAYHSYMDSDPNSACHFDADQDPNFQFDADLDLQHSKLTMICYGTSFYCRRTYSICYHTYSI
jgi:hypothetical protein